MTLILATETNPGNAQWVNPAAIGGISFPWYGSGKDGPQNVADTGFLSPYPTEHTTVQAINCGIGTFYGWSNHLDLAATESIIMEDCQLCCIGLEGNDASNELGGIGGLSAGGAQPGLDGKQATTLAGTSVTSDTAANFCDPSNSGNRTPSGSGGSSGANAGGTGGSDSDFVEFNYFPPFRTLYMGGMAPAYPISLGGYGGAAGAGDGVNLGGGGGGGGSSGGAICLRAPVITLTNVALGAFGESGGAGGASSGGNAAGGGGGGGGCGGIIIFVAETLNLTGVTYNVTGGDGGTGGAGSGTGESGVPGANGNPGIVYWYRPSTNTWVDLLD
jgi:hypothetical protein